MKSSDLCESITNRIINGLQDGHVPWRNPIKEGVPTLPTNLISGKEYTGINVLLLSMADFTSNFWCTYNQACSAGGSIKPGSESTPIVFWNIRVSHKRTKETIDHQTYLNLPKNQKLDFTVKPFGQYYSLFNADQIDGLELPPPVRNLSLNQKMTECENIVAEYSDKPKIIFKPCVPHYAPAVDEIRMPNLNEYRDSESFYSILFHEMAHSSGHTSRLNRPGVTLEKIEFGTESYALEELIAEICSSFLCGLAQIENTVLDNNISYINNWISVLNNDKYMIVKAASQAQRAFNYITKGGSI
jgi:antirestriction protein ArdC